MTQLTPEQVQRVERHLAEVVMQYKRFSVDNGVVYTYDQYQDKAPFQPLSNSAQAAMVRKKMVVFGCIVSGDGRGEYYRDAHENAWSYSIGVPSRVRADLGFKRAFAEAPTESEASSVAAYLATGGKL